MKAAWQWFLAHGDKLLAATSVFLIALQREGAVPASWDIAATAAAGASILHLVVLPEPSTPAAPPAAPVAVGKIGSFLLGALFIGLAMSLHGCSSLGVTAPANLDQELAYAYSGVTAGLNTLAQATASGVLGSAEAGQVNTVLLSIKGNLDLARAAETSNASQAQSYLTAATALLTNVSAYLACKQGKGATCQLP